MEAVDDTDSFTKDNVNILEDVTDSEKESTFKANEIYEKKIRNTNVQFAHQQKIVKQDSSIQLAADFYV